jgi:uncharacterized protein YjiS (DUF1127 family)
MAIPGAEAAPILIVVAQSRWTARDARTGSRTPLDATPGDAPSPGLRALFCGWLENHAARRRLRRCAVLDRRFAADIGLTPEEMETECLAPFWIAVPRVTFARPAGRDARPGEQGLEEKVSW